MSLILFIVVNTIIGLVLFPIHVAFIYWYADKKYGIDVTEESLEDSIKQAEDVSNIIGIKIQWLIYFIEMLDVLLWEIALPMNIWLNLVKIKDLHEIRGGENRKIIRRKDRKLKEMKESIKNLTEFILAVKELCESDIKNWNVIRDIFNKPPNDPEALKRIEQNIKGLKKAAAECQKVIDDQETLYGIKIKH